MFWMSRFAVAIGVCLLALNGPALAEEDSSFPVVEEWIISAKAGSESEFMAALKAHVIWRRENHDPWTWDLYGPETGRMDAGILIRSTGHKYSELGAYAESDFNQMAGRHWDETVAPYSGVATRYLRFQTDAGNWPDGKYDYLLIWHVDIDRSGGDRGAVYKATKELYDILREAGVEAVHGLEFTWAGGGAPFQHIDGYKDWASTSPGASLAKESDSAIAKKLGREKADEMYQAAGLFAPPSMKIYRRLAW